MGEVLYSEYRYAAVKKQEKKERIKEPKEVFRQYSLDGDFVREYITVKDAADAIGVGVFNINRVLAGTRKQAGGFQWKKEPFDSLLQKIAPLEKRVNTSGPKEIWQLSPEGEIIARYPSISDASRAVGINAKSIRQAANGIQNHAGGFYWQFVDEYNCNQYDTDAILRKCNYLLLRASNG